MASKKPTTLRKMRMNRFSGGKKRYEKRLLELQYDMLRIQRAYGRQARRAVLVFEGQDAAGKGGAIRRLTAKLDPRRLHVVPIGPPGPDDQGRHYLHRFWRELPRPGTLGIFDRSWYGRLLVERVEGFAERSEWKRAFREINEFERMLVDDGVRVVKFFMHISKSEQLERFQQRFTDPYKRWKLTADDLRNRAKWDDYEQATEAMLSRTSTERAPWHVIGANDKKYARIRVLEIATKVLGEGVDVVEPMLSDELVALATDALGVDPDGIPVARKAQR